MAPGKEVLILLVILAIVCIGWATEATRRSLEHLKADVHRRRWLAEELRSIIKKAKPGAMELTPEGYWRFAGYLVHKVRRMAEYELDVEELGLQGRQMPEVEELEQAAEELTAEPDEAEQELDELYENEVRPQWELEEPHPF